ncbi:MAG: lysoplasmalogenase, partial [Chitinophagaceae bacterium]|nr:lysoplasmalogenase [Chitinophagaceae bacterium]
MQLFKKEGIFIFWLALFTHCAFIYLGKTEYRQITKLLIMPILILYLFASVKKNRYQTSKIIIFTGLIFSFLGDALLIKSGPTWFIAGMIAFLITHICYTSFFLRIAKVKFTNATEFAIAAVVVSVISVKILQFLGPYLGDMKLPVKIYVAAISVMAATAANLLGNKLLKILATSFFIPGAILFIVSDATLAVNHFIYHEPFLDVVVMMS